MQRLPGVVVARDGGDPGPDYTRVRYEYYRNFGRQYTAGFRYSF